MKIVYFGTDVFLSCFEYLAQGNEILALYTYHNDEDYFHEYNIVQLAHKLNIPVYYQSITPRRIEQYFKDEGCELFFSAEYDRILQIPPHLTQFKGINVHSSLLPQGRSYYPIECAMQQGLAKTGVTIHKMASLVDSGSIIAQHEAEITPETDSIDIYLDNAAAARKMLEKIMENLDAALENATPQAQPTPYWKRPEADALTITHDMSRQEAAERFRCFNSMTQVMLEGVWYYISALSCGTAPLERAETSLAPDRFLYSVNDGHLRLTVHPISLKEAY